MRDIETIIRQVDTLRPVSQVANKIMSIAKDPNSSMSELSDVILYDQALTANLLKMCNSAYFGLPKKVESVHQAIVYLGVNHVIDLVLIMKH